MKHKNGRLTAESAAAMAGEQSLVDVLDEDLHPLCPNSNLFYVFFSITILSKDNTLHYGNDVQMWANSQRSTQNKGLWISENLIFFKYIICLSHTETNILGFSQAQKSKQTCLENTFSVLPLNASSLSMQLLNKIDIPSSAISWHRLIQMDGLLWSLIVQKPLSGVPRERETGSQGNPTRDSSPKVLWKAIWNQGLSDLLRSILMKIPCSTSKF